MAMVEAINDKGNRIKVSRHSYEALFKSKGYVIVVDNKNKKVEEPKEIVEDFEEVKEETEQKIDTVPI